MPTVLAIVALSVGFLNGFFSAQLTKLENQRHDLETQVRAFEEKRDDLSREYEKAKMELAATKAQLLKTEQQMALANEQIELLASRLKMQPDVVRHAIAQLVISNSSTMR